MGYAWPHRRHFRPRTKEEDTDSPPQAGARFSSGGVYRPGEFSATAETRARGVQGTRSYLSRRGRVGGSTSIPSHLPSPSGRGVGVRVGSVAVASQGLFPQPLWIRYPPSCQNMILGYRRVTGNADRPKIAKKDDPKSSLAERYY